MECASCQGPTIKWGKDRNGHQRHRRKSCGVTITDTPPPSPIAPMRIGMDRAVLVLSLLVEGMSIRSAERVTGHHRDTICRLLVLAGDKCEALLERLTVKVEPANVELDELWAYCGMKEKTKARQRIRDPFVGDSYTWLALDADSKMVLAHHVGRRTSNHADAFVEKLDQATAGRFQVTTDGFAGYPEAVAYHLGTRTDYAVLIKEFGTETAEERRYSPPRIIGTTKTRVHGNPNPARVCTSHVELLNLDIRMKCRRFTRLTNAFSKKWKNHRAAVALTVAHYNLCKMHSAIRMTPAMKAGVASSFLSSNDLFPALVAPGQSRFRRMLREVGGFGSALAPSGGVGGRFRPRLRHRTVAAREDLPLL